MKAAQQTVEDNQSTPSPSLNQITPGETVESVESTSSRIYTNMKNTHITIEEHKDITLSSLSKCIVHIKSGSSLYFSTFNH